jgi:hypothetical protein
MFQSERHFAPLSHSFRLPVQILESLASGGAAYDFEFDEILPSRFREISDVHWTPIDVARKIAFVLQDRPRARFMDVGSGAGKLCLLLALMTELNIHGIEQREDLVKVSRKICDANAPGRINIIHGNMVNLDWDQYDIFYFYNPFHEHVCSREAVDMIDYKVSFNKKVYLKYIEVVFRQLELLKPKQKVITFHGYGGGQPPSLKLLQSFKMGHGTLNIWEKV